MPERENLRYYIVSMDWYQRWEAYSKDQENAVFPGPINSNADLKKLIVTQDLLQFGDLEHYFTDYNLKDGAKEDVHYKILDEKTWNYLYSKY